MRKQRLRIAIAQINCTVGDLEGNSQKIIDYIQKAKAIGADIVSFPELSITGYPPEDLLLKAKFIRDNLSTLNKLVKSVGDIVAVIGYVDKKQKSLYNSAAVIYKSRIYGVCHKMLLPNYGVFDEKRYFDSEQDNSVFKFGDVLFGINICEDIWHEEGPAYRQATCGAKLIININASPYHAAKIKEREAVIQKQAKKNKVLIAYANLVGGQDELVFDGQSMIVNASGRVIARAEAFKEELLALDVDIPVAKKRTTKNIINITNKFFSKEKTALVEEKAKLLNPVEEVYQALLLGLHDYVTKNGFKKVVIGLSGGIDSALVAVIAADALGKDNVTCVFMPSRYSSQDSRQDAQELAKNLGVKLLEVSIEEAYGAYLSMLARHFEGLAPNIAEENLQARIRGNILMAFSNKFGWLVLTTGNKSEMSTGYATLYGDMAGGFAVIKDVPKVLVYKLSRYRNSLGVVIPERVFTKAPTAELRPNQKDSDTLPIYETLDPILKAYVEEDNDSKSIIAKGFDKDIVSRVLNMVDKSEYKRRQSPPGIKITPKSFGRDRRMPITNKYKG